MKQILLFATALFVFCSCSNETEQKTKSDSVVSEKTNPVSDSAALNFTDANGLRQGHWIITANMLNKTVTVSYSKVEEGMYKDGKQEGVWKTYFPNGNLKTEGAYVNGRLTGEFKVYDEKGKRIYKNGA